MRRLSFCVLFVLLALLAVTPVFAQGETPVEPPAPITVEQAAELLLAAIGAIVVGGLGNAPVTTFIVGLLKRVPFLNGIGASTIQLVVGGLITAMFWIATRFGYETQFNSAAELIVVAGPVLLNFLATLTGSSVIYKAAKSAGDPAFGYKRPHAEPLTADAIDEARIRAVLVRVLESSGQLNR